MFEGWRKRWRARRDDARARSAEAESVGRRIPTMAVEELRTTLIQFADEPDVLRAASRASRSRGTTVESDLLARLADSPDDAATCLDLGLHFDNAGATDVAVAFLERAVGLNPLDPIARSELALCLSLLGQHARVVEVLALHPCLAEDPGALFQFGVSSLHVGDRATAESTLDQLDQLGTAPRLADKLRAALSDVSGR